MAARLQAAVAEPISLNAARVYVSVTVGFVLVFMGKVSKTSLLKQKLQFKVNYK